LFLIFGCTALFTILTAATVRSIIRFCLRVPTGEPLYDPDFDQPTSINFAIQDLIAENSGLTHQDDSECMFQGSRVHQTQPRGAKS